MEFNQFIKNEFSRLFNNIAYKMEAEKLFIDSIKKNNFYYIEDYEDGIKSNLYNNNVEIDAHISIFNSNKIEYFVEDIALYNVSVILQKKSSTYNLLFLVKKPILKKLSKDEKSKGEKNEKTKEEKESDGIISSFTDLLSDKKETKKSTESNDLISNFKNLLFGGLKQDYYPIKYTNIHGGKGVYSESELDKIKRRDSRRSKFQIKYMKNKKNKDSEIALDTSDKYKKKKLGNKFSKKEVRDIIGSKCENFNNMYKDLSILMINIFDISNIELVENIFHIYYLVIFSYILPNLYNNFKNINKVEKIDIDFDSLINSNNVLKESLKSIFFINKKKEIYDNIIDIKNNIIDLPYELGNIDIVISKEPLKYKLKL